MRTLIVALVFVLAAADSGAGADVVKPKETRKSTTNGYVGKRVEPFTAVTLSGAKLSSEEHGAEVLIITLWGLGCASCLDEMVALDHIYEEFRGKGLKIWAVNTEDIGPEEIEKGLRARDLLPGYDLVPDPGLVVTKKFTSWFIPVTVIVDRQGIVQYYKVGFNDTDTERIEAKVGALLAR